MKCPKCHSEDVEMLPRSVALARPSGTWRHHHGRCRGCHEIVWWNAQPGDTEPVARVGSHECGFFKPSPPPA